MYSVTSSAFPLVKNGELSDECKYMLCFWSALNPKNSFSAWFAWSVTYVDPHGDPSADILNELQNEG